MLESDCIVERNSVHIELFVGIGLAPRATDYFYLLDRVADAAFDLELRMAHADTATPWTLA